MNFNYRTDEIGLLSLFCPSPPSVRVHCNSNSFFFCHWISMGTLQRMDITLSIPFPSRCSLRNWLIIFLLPINQLSRFFFRFSRMQNSSRAQGAIVTQTTVARTKRSTKITANERTIISIIFHFLVSFGSNVFGLFLLFPSKRCIRFCTA